VINLIFEILVLDYEVKNIDGLFKEKIVQGGGPTAIAHTLAWDPAEKKYYY